MQNYNLIHDVRDMEHDSPSNSEPVSLTEMKDFLRLEGFEDDLASTSEVAFSSDDDLVRELITAARVDTEKFTGLSLIPKSLRAVITNLAGQQEIPGGPIGDVNSLFYAEDYDEDGESATNNIADIETTGFEFKTIRLPNAERMILNYTCGYGRGDTPRLPKGLKLAIMVQVVNLFEHRGDELEDEGLSKRAKRLASPYKRTTWLV